MKAYRPDGRRLDEVGRLIGGIRVEVGGRGVGVREGVEVPVKATPVWRIDLAVSLSPASALA
jgi:hypothetical protein